MPKMGLVLGGGGSRGAYEIGVWQAARELGIEFEVITGTSIGALNGALMLQGDFDAAKKMWEAMSYEAVMASVTAADLETMEGARQVFQATLGEIVRDGGMDITPLETLVREMMDEDLIRSSPIKFGIVTVEFPGLRAQELTKEEIPYGQLADYLLASSACYPAFKPREIGTTRFVDGGYKDNLPIDLAISLGAKEILAVDLRSLGVVKKQDYDVPVRYLRSYWELGGFLTFDPQRIRRNIWVGYLDTMKAYDRYEGFAYTFELGENERNFASLSHGAAELLDSLSLSLEKEKKNWSPLEALVRHRMTKALRWGKRRRVNHSDYFARAAELAGEFLGLPPDRAYTRGEFNTLLLEEFRKMGGYSFTELEETFKEATFDPKSVALLAQRFGKMEVAQLLSFLHGWIADEVGGRPRNLPLAVAVLPRQFAAAFYLYLIEHLPQEAEVLPSLPDEEPVGESAEELQKNPLPEPL